MMKYRFIPLPLVVAITGCLWSQARPDAGTPAGPTRLPPAAVAEVAAMVTASGGLDLDDDGVAGEVAVPGWEGYPTRLSSYHKKDADGTVKPARVIMLNPSPEQAARWIVQAILDATGSYDKQMAARLVREALLASGFQFVVRGVHWEDMDGDGVYQAYPFMDGVTVQLKRFGKSYPARALTSAEIDYTLSAPESEIIHTGQYARIQSTSRRHYQMAGGKKPVEGDLWRKTIRELYQEAWGNDRNELMSAKAKAMFPRSQP